MLADFRNWLLQAAAAPNNGEPNPPAAPAEPVDLHTLLGQFIALRHEVNLQTRATRAQQEQTADALGQLDEALALLRQRQEASRDRPLDEEEALRPLLKTLVDLHDALALAGREVQRVETVLLPALDQLTAAPEPAPVPPPPVPEVKLPFWARLLGAGPAVRQALEERRSPEPEAPAWQPGPAEQAAARVRQLVTSLVTGYTMSVQRVERALQQHGLEPIPSVGEPFDPEAMEAVEVVTEGGRESTEVLEEVRRGYRWRGRVFRYAQVKVARPGR